MTQRRRLMGAALGLLLVGVLLSGCGSTPVAKSWPGLTVTNDTVYVISGQPQRLYLLNSETGVQKGTPFVPQPEPRGVPYFSPVAMGEDLAFVGFGVSEAKSFGLYAVNPETGVEKWHLAAQGLILAAPAIAGDTIYFGSSEGQVYAVDIQAQSVKKGWPFLAQEAVWSTPLVVNDRVYVTSMDHHLYCLDAGSGKEIWKFQTKGAIAAPPALDAARGVLYVGDFSGRVYAVDTSGKAVEGFAFQAENWIWSQVVVAGDRLYVTSLDGNLYALDPATGARLAPYPFDGGDALRAAPVLAGDLILVASQEGKLTALNAESAVQQWQWPKPPAQPPGSILTTPVVVDEVVYVVVMVNQKPSAVYALDLETGDQAPGNWPAPPAPAQ